MLDKQLNHDQELSYSEFRKQVLEDFLLITIFGGEISLGFLRLKVAESTGKIEKILG